jgi:hypothetical protein
MAGDSVSNFEIQYILRLDYGKFEIRLMARMAGVYFKSISAPYGLSSLVVAIACFYSIGCLDSAIVG